MKKILIAITFLTLITGCKKDYFDVGPTGSAAAQDIFTTTANASNVMNGCTVIYTAGIVLKTNLARVVLC